MIQVGPKSSIYIYGSTAETVAPLHLKNSFSFATHKWRCRNSNISYQPRPDGTVLTASPDVLVKNGQYAKVPFIIGDQEDEGLYSP
jgi:carboxylesterase type B